MTADQIQALGRFAAKYSRNWKSKLCSTWASGRDTNLPEGEWPFYIANNGDRTFTSILPSEY